MFQPSIFISHGSPMMALADEEDAYFAALRRYVSKLEKPKAVVIVSAHGLSRFPAVEVLGAKQPRLLYDFGGFPEELYRVEYPCPGDPALAARISSLLADAGFSAELSTEGLLDHGVWVPLRILFPAADVPVLQITMPFPSDPRWVMKLGKALSELRREGVLLIGSGGAVHNLRRLRWDQKHGPGEAWALRFEEWVKDCLREKDVERLLDFETDAPEVNAAHPTTEHFFPIFFAVGAACPGDELATIFEGVEYGTLSMFSFALEAPLESSLESSNGPGQTWEKRHLH